VTDAAGNVGALSGTVTATTLPAGSTPPPIITSPVSGTLALAGQSLSISANISAGAFPNGVALLAQDPLDSAFIQTAAGSAVSFSLPIPPDTPPGPYMITVVGVNPAGAAIPSAQISVDIEQASQPTAVTPYPSVIAMASVGDTRALTVLAYFPGNSQIDISRSSQLTVLSSNPNIATVQNGTITAVAGGTTGIVVQYGAISTVIPVSVP
jgi:hypothetical protein